jgi:fructose-1,6-bisphosphatase I
MSSNHTTPAKAPIVTRPNQIVTIERHILDRQTAYPEARGELTQLLYDIALTAKLIGREVNKAGLVDILGETGVTNVQGESVQKLDDYANECFIKTFDHGGLLCVMASEEEDDPVQIPAKFECGDYVLLFDPLDGSSNIDANVSVGSIWSIYKRKTASGPGTLEDLLRPGSEQVAAGYIAYGSSTMLVYTTGTGVSGFTLDPSIGEFLLSHPNIQMPKQGNIYSLNEGYRNLFFDSTARYLDYLQEIDDETGRPHSGRYIGSMVADVHRTLLKGGVFIYPETTKNPGGKLRLLYEASPMGFVIEQAGGRATTGRGPILDVEAVGIHQRTPVILGATAEVDRVVEYLD